MSSWPRRTAQSRRVGMQMLAKQEEKLAEERDHSDQRFQQLIQSFVRAMRNGH